MGARVPDGWRKTRRYLYPVAIGLTLFVFLAMITDLLLDGLNTLNDWLVVIYVSIATSWIVFFFILFFRELSMFGTIEREFIADGGIDKEALRRVVEGVVIDEMTKAGYRVSERAGGAEPRREGSGMTAAHLMLESGSYTLPPLWFDHITDTRSVIVYVRPGHWDMVPMVEGAMMNLR